MRVVHAAWLAAAVAEILILLISLKGYLVWFRGESPFTPGPDPINGLNVLSGILSLIAAITCLILSLLLFLQKRHEPMALFVSFYVMVYGIVLAGPLEHLNQVIPGITYFAMNIAQPIFLAMPTVWVIILLPDGRAVPTWTRWLFPLSLASLIFFFSSDIDSFSKLNTLPVQLVAAYMLVLYGLAFGAQVYRYRRISTPAQQLQTKWLLFGFIVWMVLMILQSIPYILLQNLPPDAPRPAWASASALLWWLTVATIPIALSISTLRYRLYEIDLIINRALLYSALTAILAGLYAASISLFQKVFIALTGAKSDAAIVITTLILATTFTPIKTRLQTIIDRRYRDVHEPLRQLEEFSRQIDGGIWVVDRKLILERLLEQTMTAFGAINGLVTWVEDSGEPSQIVHGDWSGDSQITVPLSQNGRLLGQLSLGMRRNKAAYTPEDLKSLASTADAVTRALAAGTTPAAF
jgi:hypothetical protein